MVESVFMRLAESLRKNIIEITSGRILNKFKIRNRRDVLFFEDIFANYIKECEKAGYVKETAEIGQKWTNLNIQNVVQPIFKKAPLFFLNTIMRNVWSNLGLIDNIEVTKDRNIIKIETKNEVPTRIIGKNNFIIGSYVGILNILFNSHVECFKASQTKKYCYYVFNIKYKPFIVSSYKEKRVYDKLNQSKNIEGFTLKDLLKKGIFQLKEDNKLYFRGKSIIAGENTLAHLIGNSKLLLEKIPHISYIYFKEIIKESTDEEKLLLIKTLLQAMGWGTLKIIETKKNVHLEIKNPPHGLQLEKDNWEFLTRTILGYLWLLDKKFIVRKVNEQYKKLIITYSKGSYNGFSNMGTNNL